MTEAEQAANDARQALTAALAQIAGQVHGPYSRLDEDARNAYLALHTTTAKIVQRLAWEIGHQSRDLEAQQQAIADKVALFEQQRLNSLTAPIQAAQQRVGGELLRAIHRGR